MATSCSSKTLKLFIVCLICRSGTTQQTPSEGFTGLHPIEVLIQQGRLEEAQTAALEELRRNPSSVEGYNLLGIIEGEKQDYSGADAAFRKALDLAPNSTKTHNNLGKVYLAQKRSVEAEKEFRISLQLDPGNREGNYNLGLLELAKGSPANAISHLERVNPKDLETRFNLIRAYLQNKRTAEAMRMATALSLEHKDDVQVHFSLGVLLASEGQYKAAKIELGRADVLQPESPEILYNLGQVLLRLGDYREAELVASRVAKLSPSSENLYLLAQVYTRESRPLDALDLLVRANKITPENPDILFLMAQISISQRYFEDAIPLLEKGREIAPQRSDIRAALGESYYKSDKIDKAIEEFKNLIEIAPSTRSYGFLGLSYTYLGRLDEAKQSFQSGLTLEPHDSFCLFHLGYIAKLQGDFSTADAIFQKVLHSNPDFPYALLELANLRIESKRLPEAEELLRKYVRVSHSPATGYYKLSIIEKKLHETEASERDLALFQSLSKEAPANSYPYENLFDYLDNRLELDPHARVQQDLADLVGENEKHPNQPNVLYPLAEAYLRSGKMEEAKSTIAQLDKASSNNSTTLTGTGVLLARYHLYDDAIEHFQEALRINTNSDEVNFDLANAYFSKGLFSEALESANRVSAEGRKDSSYLALLGDIYARLGETPRAEEIFRSAIKRNPDNDQNYLSLALLQFRDRHVSDAKQTLLAGQAHVPGSGKLLWGLGLASALDGDTRRAADQFEKAVDILPEWPGAYSTLGVFYFQTGQIAKAKEVLDRFKSTDKRGSLDITKIEQVLAQAPLTSATGNEPMTVAQRDQFLQMALYLADKTL